MRKKNRAYQSILEEKEDINNKRKNNNSKKREKKIRLRNSKKKILTKSMGKVYNYFKKWEAIKQAKELAKITKV